MTMSTILLYYYMTAHHLTPRESYRYTVIALQSIKSIFVAIPHSAICQVADRASVLLARVRWRFYAGVACVRLHAGTITVMLIMSMLQWGWRLRLFKWLFVSRAYISGIHMLSKLEVIVISYGAGGHVKMLQWLFSPYLVISHCDAAWDVPLVSYRIFMDTWCFIDEGHAHEEFIVLSLLDHNPIEWEVAANGNDGRSRVYDLQFSCHSHFK